MPPCDWVSKKNRASHKSSNNFFFVYLPPKIFARKHKTPSLPHMKWTLALPGKLID